MHEFRIVVEGVRPVEYVVLRCPSCGMVQRFMHKQECFGKVPRTAGCKQCQKPIAIAENNMDYDPLPAGEGENLYSLVDGVWVPIAAKKGGYNAEFTTADKV